MKSSNLYPPKPDVIVFDDVVISEEERKRLNYEEEKAYILNEASRFFVPSLRWIESTRNQFKTTGRRIQDYFMVETYDALSPYEFNTPKIHLIWVKKDSSQSK